jgi:hypothetical protein
MKQYHHHIQDPASAITFWSSKHSRHDIPHLLEHHMEIATSTCPMVSAKSEASQHTPLNPHELMFVDVPDQIPSNPVVQEHLANP